MFLQFPLFVYFQDVHHTLTAVSARPKTPYVLFPNLAWYEIYKLGYCREVFKFKVNHACSLPRAECINSYVCESSSWVFPCAAFPLGCQK